MIPHYAHERTGKEHPHFPTNFEAVEGTEWHDKKPAPTYSIAEPNPPKCSESEVRVSSSDRVSENSLCPA